MKHGFVALCHTCSWSQAREILRVQMCSTYSKSHSVPMKGSVHCSAALPHPMHYLSAKMKRRGVGNFIETNYVLATVWSGCGTWSVHSCAADQWCRRRREGVWNQFQRSGYKVQFSLLFYHPSAQLGYPFLPVRASPVLILQPFMWRVTYFPLVMEDAAAIRLKLQSLFELS